MPAPRAKSREDSLNELIEILLILRRCYVNRFSMELSQSLSWGTVFGHDYASTMQGSPGAARVEPTRSRKRSCFVSTGTSAAIFRDADGSVCFQHPARRSIGNKTAEYEIIARRALISKGGRRPTQDRIETICMSGLVYMHEVSYILCFVNNKNEIRKHLH